MNDLSSRDRAKGPGGMQLHELERLLSDAENEPQWRESANKCADYYDHKQASQKRIERCADTGEPLIIVNLIQRTINGALGQEAKTRLNWKVDADSDSFADVSTVLNERLTEAQREGNPDMAISEAYSSMLRTGIGWVEVSRAPDPLAYPYRFTALHRNDVWWDWRARLSDKSDSRWMLRQRWVDLDEAMDAMPQFRDLLEMGCHSGPITDSMSRNIMATSGQFESIHATRRAFTRTEEEWLDNSVRRRIRMYSVYYKSFKQEIALVNGTRRVRFNPQNPIHAALVQSGGAQLIKGPSHTIRHAMFAGPFRLFDTELRTRKFPLVPFVCYSADDDRSPYGLVHGMIEPQDEYNERRSRLKWLLEAKQVFVDNDALDTTYNNLTDLAREVMRPDAQFVMNPNRRNKDGLRVEMNHTLQAEQAQVMNDAKVLIQDQPGLFAPQFGSNSIGANSGVALNSMMEQSVASLGETSDNYRTSRRMVGDLAVDLICEDHLAQNMNVSVGSGKRQRVVVLNTFTPEGLPVNNVEDAAVRVGLGDIPSTTAFRAQQAGYLSNALNSVGNDPIARAVLVPALMESMDIEHRNEYAQWMRKKAGVPEPDDMGENSEVEQQEAAAAQQAQQVQARDMEATLAKKEADAARSAALAERDSAQARAIDRQSSAANEDQLIQDALLEASAA